jgi:sugar lactone lactonase YvrE
MSRSTSRNTFLLSLLALSLSLGACQLSPLEPVSQGGAPQAVEQGSLNVSIRWPQRQDRALQAIPLGADQALLVVTDPQGATRGTLHVARAAQGARASLVLPVGKDYRVTVRMIGPGEEVMAAGESALFEIVSNQATSVPVRLDPIVTTVAGTGIDNHVGEGVPATEAAIQNPSDVGTDAAGNLYIAVRKVGSLDGNVIRKVSPAGVITTVVGHAPGSDAPYAKGDVVPAAHTLLNSPSGLAVSEDGALVIADKIYQSTPVRYRILVVPARDGERYGRAMRAGHSYSIYETTFAIANVVMGPDGTVYASVRNWIIRLDPQGRLATVAGIEGDTKGGAGEDGPATASQLLIPDGMALDPYGNLFFADRSNQRIRMLCQAPGRYYGMPMQAGSVYSVAGLKVSGAWQRTSTLFPYVDGKPGLASSLFFPRGLAMDDRGNLFFADSSNNLIRRLSPDGMLSTVAGSGRPTKLGTPLGALGDGGSSFNATFGYPGGLAIGPLGALYVADSTNNRVRRIRI